jgi:translocation and assembly module TamB
MALPARLRRVVLIAAATVAAVGAALAGLLLLAVVLIFAAVHTQDGRDLLAQGIERLLARPDGSGVRIGAIAPGLPARLRVERVEVADAGGTWLAIDELLLSWRPSAMLTGRLRIDVLSARTVDVRRLPAAEEAPPAAEPIGPPRLPRLPIGVHLDRLAVGELRLGETVAGQPMRLGIDGRLAAVEGDAAERTIRTELSVVPLDGGGGAVLLDADLDPATNGLAIEASIDEPEGGLVDGLLGLAPRTPLAVRLNGRGPLDD